MTPSVGRLKAFPLLLATTGLLFLALHLRSLPPTLEDIDSVNLALGVESFDVGAHRPHPPGYPVYIVLAKASTAALGALRPSWDRDRRAAAGLAIWSVLGGALAVWAIAALWTALGFRPMLAWLAALVCVTAPLFWFTAARPLTDTPGLTIALAIQALVVRGLLRARSGVHEGITLRHPLAWAAFAAGLGIGFRSQILWLTAPLLIWAVLDLALRRRFMDVLWVVNAAAAGILIWAVPLILMSGGPQSYLASVRYQSTHDIEGAADLLIAKPSWRLFTVAMARTFIEPWQIKALAYVVLLLAIVGSVRLARREPRVLLLVLVAFGPYLVFHVVFHETASVRYGLPLLVPMAGLAVAGLGALGTTVAIGGAVAVAIASLVVAQPRLAAYGEVSSPVFRAFQDMSRALPATPPQPQLRMHHQVWWGVSRALEWYRPVWDTGQQPFPGDREWLTIALHFLTGNERPIWQLSDLTRTDIALFDPRGVSPGGRYEPRADVRALIGGIRLDGLSWFILNKPRWMLGTGWALTPEVAGMTAKDRSGPHVRPAEAFLLRDARPLRIMIGGRLLSGAPPAVTVTFDGTPLTGTDEWWRTPPSPFPPWFVQWFELPEGVAAGSSRYAQLTVKVPGAAAGQRPNVIGLEQFDAAPIGEPIVAFMDGWGEPEGDPTGRRWRWTTERAALLLKDARDDLRLVLAGESPLRYYQRAPTVVVRAGEREIGRFSPAADFTQTIDLPAEAVQAAGGRLTIETELTHVPAERGGSGDRRRLGLRLFRVEVQRR